jgi:hypothetical protein
VTAVTRRWVESKTDEVAAQRLGRDLGIHTLAAHVLAATLVVPLVIIVGGLALYLKERPAALRLVWPEGAGKASA